MVGGCPWLTLALHIFSVGYAKPLAYPEGVKPGDQISGNSGEFWRYKHVLIKPPDDEDRMEALKMSEDVKCAACETILQRLMKRVESNGEDHIMDALDGEPTETPEPTGDPQEDRVNMNKRGCNKHFKDELLYRGWVVQKCPVQESTSVKILGEGEESRSDKTASSKTWCLQSVGDGQVDSRTADTYNVRSEAAFNACENTIARYGHEIAKFLAERLEEGGDLNAAIKDACLKAAKCDGAKETAQKNKEAARNEKTKKKKRKKTADEDGSMWDIMNEQKEEEKKRKRRRRKKKVEL